MFETFRHPNHYHFFLIFALAFILWSAGPAGSETYTYTYTFDAITNNNLSNAQAG